MNIFVLSGGGAKGAFQVGAMKRLAEKGIIPDKIFGTSVGALNAAGYAYQGILGLEKIWDDIKGQKSILKKRYLSLIWNDGTHSTKPLRKLIEKSVEGKAMLEAVACYVDIANGGIFYRSSKNSTREDFINAVHASASIPSVMDTVNDTLVDGGAREQTPLRRSLHDLKPSDHVYVILCNPYNKNFLGEFKKTWPYQVSVGLRAIDILEYEVFTNDIEGCLDEIKSKLTIYAPDKLLIDTLDFDPEKIKIVKTQGYVARPVLEL